MLVPEYPPFMKAANAAPMIRSHCSSFEAEPGRAGDLFFVFGKDSSCIGTSSYRKWYGIVPQVALIEASIIAAAADLGSEMP
jgi:hypothetical protein